MTGFDLRLRRCHFKQPLVVTQTSASHQAGILNEAFIRLERDPEVTRTPQEKHCGTFINADVVGGKPSRRRKKKKILLSVKKKRKKKSLHVRCWKCFSCSINYSAARRRNTFLTCLNMKKQEKLIDLLRSFGSTWPEVSQIRSTQKPTLLSSTLHFYWDVWPRMSSLSVPVFKPCVSIGFVLIFFPVVFEFLTLTQLLKFFFFGWHEHSGIIKTDDTSNPSPRGSLHSK